MPEVLVAIVLASTLAGLAVVGGPALRARLELRQARAQLGADLQLARARAIAENTQMRVTFAEGTYFGERNVGGTWQPLALHGHGAASLAAETVALPSAVQLAASPDPIVVFGPDGRADASQSLTLTHHDVSAARTVSVTLAGRLSYTTPVSP